ncbi:MAG TPA: MarR family transcriptional regulator [Acidimicrobiales bacterium]|nr:MarR family transcriptional regulator [Acidimicrobiales bacterium]
MDFVARQLFLTAKALRSELDTRLGEAGSSVPFWLVLLHTTRVQGLSQRELAENMRVEAPTLTRHLDRMEAEGLIERHRDADDRRVTRLHLTAAGRRQYRRLLRVVEELDSELAALLTAEEAAVLDRALARIIDHVEDTDARDVG